jgi:hypothetical protein
LGPAVVRGRVTACSASCFASSAPATFAPRKRTVRSAKRTLSRARRYAASAAFLATGATLGCGSSGGAPTVLQGSEQGGGGTAGTNGGNGTGMSSGGSQNVGGGAGGASNAAGGGQGQPLAGSGSGGTSAAGATSAPRTGAACEGFSDPSAMGPLCGTTADCEPRGIEMVFCQRAQNPPTTNVPHNMAPPPECTTSADCTMIDGQVCVPGHDGVSRCRYACGENADLNPCTGPVSCVDGGCTPKRCDEEGALTCGEGFECDPTAPNAELIGCAVQSCSTGYSCWAGQDCAPGAEGATPQGCLQRACDTDADCDCGYCISEVCLPTLSYCYYLPPAMPYGCVWPDEEFV